MNFHAKKQSTADRLTEKGTDLLTGPLLSRTEKETDLFTGLYSLSARATALAASSMARSAYGAKPITNPGARGCTQ